MYNCVSSFFSTPLSVSLPTKLPPVFQGWPVYFIQNCLTLTGLRPGREYRSAESQMLGLKGEPDSRGSPAKLGLCVTSMIPRSGSRKSSWEAKGPSAFHRIQQCLRVSTFQGYLKPNPLGSALSSAT